MDNSLFSFSLQKSPVQVLHFFEQNVGNLHWVSSCICNPWYFIFQYYKRENSDDLSELIEKFDENDFIHGFLMFDSQFGFQTNESMADVDRYHCDVYVWMMNLASLHHDACYEDTWKELDYKMHMSFKQEAGANWQDKFNVKQSVSESYKSKSLGLNSNQMPEWFVWVVKWFQHGLNGLFGTISQFLNDFLSIFFNNNPKW